MKALILSALLALPAFASAAVCEIGRHDDHLTLPRVMQNFGRYTTEADLVSLKLNDPWKPVVTDAEITAAADRLANAVECADQVLAHPEGDLLPTHVQYLRGDERKEALETFLAFMSDFRDLLALYQKSFVDYVAAPTEKRDASTIERLRDEINDTVDRAHRKTMPEFMSASLAESLESLMKQIKVQYKQLLADGGDEAKSVANSAAATEIAALFRRAVKYTPKAIDQMPTAQRAQALAEYQKMMNDAAMTAEKLAAAFIKKDRGVIDALMEELSQLKEEGHDRFDP